MWLQCNDLRRVDLSDNKLTLASFPSDYSLGRTLSKVMSLNLSSNELRSIPGFVGQLMELRVLDVSSNRVEHLDAMLLRLRKLQVVSLHSNPPLPADVAEAAEAGGGELWLYLQAWQGGGTGHSVV